jgi:membrane associated rhomboid family serine protease
MQPLIIVLVVVFVAALVVPLVPVRRRRRAGGNATGFPVVTTCLLIVNILLFAANADPETGSLRDMTAHHWGLTPAHPYLFSLISYMFLHGTWWHVLGNMLGLWLFGPHVEEALGRLEYLFFYLGAGVAGGLTHLVIADLFLPMAASLPLVGASGAIFGVLGLYAVRFWRTRMRVFFIFTVPSVWAISVFALIQLGMGIVALGDGGASDNTANWAHVGGFLFGVLIALPLRMREDSRIEYGLEDAEAARSAGEFDAAAAHYRRVLDASPKDAAAHRAMGQVCCQLRHTVAAHRHFAEALQLYASREDAQGTAATYGDALTHFAVFPVSPRLLQRVASACEETEAYDLALTALAEVVRDHPHTPEGEMAMLRLGRLYHAKLRQPAYAIETISEFLRTYPDSSWRHHAERLLAEAEAARAAEPAAIRDGPVDRS